MVFNATLKHGSSFIVAGPSTCGKTHFTVNLLLNKNVLSNKKIDKVVIVTTHEQPIYNDLYTSGVVDEIFNTTPKYEDILEIAKRYKPF